MDIYWLTHSCRQIYLTSDVWTCHTFENNFGMKHKFAKYFKRCKFLMKFFISKIFQKLLLLEKYHKDFQTVSAATGMNGLDIVDLQGIISLLCLITSITH